MLGEQIGEMRGKRSARRVISADTIFKAEVSFEDSGKLMGIQGGNVATYCATSRPDGTLYGEGQGVFLTVGGESIAWKGIGTGRFTGGGAVSYRGGLVFTTASQKLAHLNSIAGVFEFEVDADGNTHSKIWEWK